VGGSFSSDGRRLVVVAIGGQSTFEYPLSDAGIGSGHQIEQIPKEATVARFSADGNTLAVANLFGEVRLHDATSYAPLTPPIKVSSGLIPSVVFSPDGRLLVVQDAPNGNWLLDVPGHAPVGAPIPGAGGFG
jgi:hypothetical protein